MPRRLLRHRPSPAMVVALIALAVAAGGTGYAALSLPASSVGPRQLRTGAVTGKKIKRNAVTSAKVKDASLRRRDFAAGQLPAGPAGPAGAPGPTGTPGPTGAAGAAGAIRTTQLNYTGETTSSVSFTYQRVRDLGTFTKDQAGSVINLYWQSHISANGSFCLYQLRVDGNPSDPASGEAVVYAPEAPVYVRARFTGLAAGPHTVSLWLEGSAMSCTDNKGSFTRQVFVEETTS